MQAGDIAPDQAYRRIDGLVRYVIGKRGDDVYWKSASTIDSRAYKTPVDEFARWAECKVTLARKPRVQPSDLPDA